MPDQNTGTGRRPVQDQNTVQVQPVGYPQPGSTAKARNQERRTLQPTGPVQRTGPVPRTDITQRTGPVQRTGSYQGTGRQAGYPTGEPINGQQTTGVTTYTRPVGYTGYAPELAQQRSRKVYMNDDEFWQVPDQPEEAAPEAADDATGKEQGQNTAAQTDSVDKQSVPIERNMNGVKAGSMIPDKPVNKMQRIVAPLLIGLVFVIVAVMVIFGSVFCVREIHVVGNHQISEPAVISLSGIRNGGSIFSIDEEAVAAGINSNRYLIFESMQITYPSIVSIVVRERTRAAVVSYCGVDYTIDMKGMVLEKTEELEENGEHDLVVFSGIQASGRTGCEVGYILNTVQPQQKQNICSLMVEMRVLGCESLIKTANISNTANTLLTTRDGYTIKLGDGEHLYRKLKAMLFVRNELMAMGESGGTIDVSIPETPAYIPSDE